MKKGIFPALLPHLIAIIVFLIVAVLFCNPVLQGMVLQQHDIIQWEAMAKSSFDYKAAHGHFPLWTNNLFSGMPAYQIAMDSGTLLPPQALYHVLTLFLPQPISLFFLACVSFYFLTQVLRVNPYIGIFAALTFAFATYNPIIVVAGHVTKMQSIAMMPALFASLLVLFEWRRYIAGLALTAVSAALLIGMNHPQIVYYSLLAAVFMAISFAIYWIRTGQVKHLLLSFGLAIAGGAFGVLSNAVPLFTTYEYSKSTIRGGTELADSTSNTTKDGLSEQYAFSYSMKKPEPLVMMVPDIYGGSSEPIEMKLENAKSIEALQSMPQELAQQPAGARTAYWGGIGYTSGPPYVGAIVCFLALLGFFILDSRHKWWILAATVFTILMSWGSFFEGFNRVLLHTLPFYNKFRAPSMIIVVPTFLLNFMAVLTLQKLVTTKEDLWLRYKNGILLTAGVFVLLLLLYFSFDYMSEQETMIMSQLNAAPEQVREYVRQFINALKDDRKDLFMSSIIRSLLFAGAAAAILYFTVKGKLKGWAPYVMVGSLAVIDLLVIDAKYFGKDHFTDEGAYENNFTATPADQQILQDKSDYRVFDVRPGLSVALGMQGAMPSYYHKSIGGYHPAKLSIYQDLIEHQLTKFPQSMPVLNMLNTKYIIQQDQSGKDQVYTNPDASGPAWFVKTVRFENTPADVMNSLTALNVRDTAVLFAADKNQVSLPAGADVVGTIDLLENKNDEITYRSNSANGGFGVFSEIFYNKGWRAYIDNKEVPVLRTNYVLRGLMIPAGNHEIKFVFHPQSYYTGRTIASVVNVLIWLIVLYALFLVYRVNRNIEPKHG